MSFFKNLSELGLKRVVVELILTGENPIVVLTPKSSATDSVIESMKPLILKYTSIAELDEKFFSDISQPIKSTAEFFDGVEAYQKTLDAAKLEADKAKKEADEKKKTTADKKAATKKAETSAKEEAPVKEEKKPEPVIDLFTEEYVTAELDEAEKILTEIKEEIIEVEDDGPDIPAVEEVIVPEVKEEAVTEAQVVEEVVVEKPAPRRTPSLFD